MKKITSIILALIILLTLNTAYAKTYTEKDIKLIGRVVQAEANNQPFLGKVSVALTVINRYESGKYGKSLTHITRRSQFCKARYASKASITAVKYAIDNRLLPPNVFYFQRANRKTWGGRPSIKRYCTIGAHTFYTAGKAKPVVGAYIGRDGRLKGAKG